MIYLYGLAAWLYFVVWFWAAAHYLHMKRDGRWDEVPRLFRYSLIAGLLPGLVLDALFNVTYGSIAFKEWPKEYLFSERVERWYDVYKEAYERHHPRPDRRAKLAAWWAGVLNNIDPGHIK